MTIGAKIPANVQQFLTRMDAHREEFKDTGKAADKGATKTGDIQYILSELEDRVDTIAEMTGNAGDMKDLLGLETRTSIRSIDGNIEKTLDAFVEAMAAHKPAVYKAKAKALRAKSQGYQQLVRELADLDKVSKKSSPNVEALEAIDQFAAVLAIDPDNAVLQTILGKTDLDSLRADIARSHIADAQPLLQAGQAPAPKRGEKAPDDPFEDAMWAIASMVGHLPADEAKGVLTELFAAGFTARFSSVSGTYGSLANTDADGGGEPQVGIDSKVLADMVGDASLPDGTRREAAHAMVIVAHETSSDVYEHATDANRDLINQERGLQALIGRYGHAGDSNLDEIDAGAFAAANARLAVADAPTRTDQTMQLVDRLANAFGETKKLGLDPQVQVQIKAFADAHLPTLKQLPKPGRDIDPKSEALAPFAAKIEESYGSGYRVKDHIENLVGEIRGVLEQVAKF